MKVGNRFPVHKENELLEMTGGMEEVETFNSWSQEEDDHKKKY